MGRTRGTRKKSKRPTDPGLLAGRNPHPEGRGAMLILNLKENEKILIGDKIIVMLVEIRGKQIRLGIEAPDDVLVLREKLAKKGEA